MGFGQRWPERQPRPKVKKLTAEVTAHILSAMERAIKRSPVLSARGVQAKARRGRFYGEVYVINIHDEKERKAAERTAEEIRRIRADSRILRCFHGAPRESRQISVFISNLADLKDPELKKILARLKRGMKRTQDSGDGW